MLAEPRMYGVSAQARAAPAWARQLPPSSRAISATSSTVAAPAAIDTARLPQHDGERPRDDEKADDDVADVAEIEVVEVRPEAARKRELRGGHLEQFDHADQERDGDREAGDGDVVIDLADRIGEGPAVGVAHEGAVGGVHQRHSGGEDDR